MIKTDVGPYCPSQYKLAFNLTSGQARALLLFKDNIECNSKEEKHLQSVYIIQQDAIEKPGVGELETINQSFALRQKFGLNDFFSASKHCNQEFFAKNEILRDTVRVWGKPTASRLQQGHGASGADSRRMCDSRCPVTATCYTVFRHRQPTAFVDGAMTTRLARAVTGVPDASGSR
ncbi:hypothetical protein QTP88_028115 [Uroleucon formosanum]